MSTVSLALLNAGSSQNFDGASVTLAVDLLPLVPFNGALVGSAEFNAGDSDTWGFPFPVFPAPFQACFQAVSNDIVIFNSGEFPLPTSPNSYPLFFLIKDFSQTILPSQIPLPTFPQTSGNLTADSGSLTINPGSLTISGVFTYHRFIDGLFIGSITGPYAYTFTLVPQALCNNPGEVLKVVSTSLSLSITPSSLIVSGILGATGWLLVLLGDLFLAIFAGAFASSITSLVQQALDSAVNNSFAQQAPPPGTTACVTGINISGTSGITLAITAAVPGTSVCPSTMS